MYANEVIGKIFLLCIDLQNLNIYEIKNKMI